MVEVEEDLSGESETEESNLLTVSLLVTDGEGGEGARTKELLGKVYWGVWRRLKVYSTLSLIIIIVDVKSLSNDIRSLTHGDKYTKLGDCGVVWPTPYTIVIGERFFFDFEVLNSLNEHSV